MCLLDQFLAGQGCRPAIFADPVEILHNRISQLRAKRNIYNCPIIIFHRLLDINNLSNTRRIFVRQRAKLSDPQWNDTFERVLRKQIDAVKPEVQQASHSPHIRRRGLFLQESTFRGAESPCSVETAGWRIVNEENFAKVDDENGVCGGEMAEASRRDDVFGGRFGDMAVAVGLEAVGGPDDVVEFVEGISGKGFEFGENVVSVEIWKKG